MKSVGNKGAAAGKGGKQIEKTDKGGAAGKPSAAGGGPASNTVAISGMPWWFPALIGVAILGYFGWLHWQMFELANLKSTDAEVWQRRWMLFASLEAIALAAAGAILGHQIQRGRVEAAERQTTNAQEAADNANANATAAAETTADLRARAESYVASLEVAEATATSGRKTETASRARQRSQVARRMLLG